MAGLREGVAGCLCPGEVVRNVETESAETGNETSGGRVGTAWLTEKGPRVGAATGAEEMPDVPPASTVQRGDTYLTGALMGAARVICEVP